MSFPRYPKYKDSGVEWLGEVPEHWNLVPLKWLAEFINGDAFKPSEWSESGIPIIRIQNLNGSEDFNYFDGEVYPRHLVRSGDLLFGWSGNRGTSFGPFLWQRKEVCALNQHIFRVVPTDIDIQSLYWILKAVTAHVEDQAHGIIGMVHITKGDLGAIAVPVPSTTERSAVSAFLDRETAKIDALVAEQRRLIELLKEKRQAVISHAVTKGLNPHAPMKPSGIEWLGDVPEHWTVHPLRRFRCIVQTGPFGSQLHAEEYVEGGIPVINPVNLVHGRIVPSTEVTVTHDVLERLPHQRLKAGDIVFSRRGELGRCALVSEREAGWLCGTGSMIVRLEEAEFRSDYLTRFLSLALLRQYFESFSVGTIMDSLSSTTLLGMPLIVPPAREQDAIAEFAECETRRLDSLTVQAERAIDLLQERRTALISAAVTGKIDVRGFAVGQTGVVNE